MEGKGVDGPDLIDVVGGLTVAIERIFFFLGGEESKYSTAMWPSTEAVKYTSQNSVTKERKEKETGDRKIKEREKKNVKAPW